MAYAQTIMQGGLSAGTSLAIAGGVATGLVAAGTTQTTALDLGPLTGHMIATAAASSGVQLNPGSPGDSCWVYNGGANTVTVYPPNSAKFNSLSTNSGIALATATRADFDCVSATQWTVNLSA